MSPKRTKRVNVPLTESEKEKWDSVTGDGERFSSLAELARTSVHRELEGQHDQSSDSDRSVAVDGALADSIEQMSGSLNQVESAVSDLETRFDRLDERVTAEGPEMKLQKVIFDLLPVEPDGTDEAVTPHELADKYGFDVEETEKALERLEGVTSAVRGEQMPDKRTPEHVDVPPVHYYRTEDGGPR